MSSLLQDIQERIGLISLNRVSKHNAFDDTLLKELQAAVEDLGNNPKVRVILLKGNGKHFSAGADLEWMQRMALFSFEENLSDALVLAQVMYSLHQCAKPVIAMVHGAAYGGGAGIVSACDIAIAADTARFCFSEVKLGLIPAVISPYVVKAIGERAARALFISAETFDGPRAKELGLVHHCVPEKDLLEFSLQYAHNISHHAPLALGEAKKLAGQIAGKEINNDLLYYTAELIAKKRTSEEGRKGLQAFLNKETPQWE